MRLLSKEIAAPLGKDGKEVEIPRDSFQVSPGKISGTRVPPDYAFDIISVRGDIPDPLHI